MFQPRLDHFQVHKQFLKKHTEVKYTNSFKTVLKTLKLFGQFTSIHFRKLFVNVSFY